MNNYEYIAACLPVISLDAAASERFDADAVIADIRGQLSDKDTAILDGFLAGYSSEAQDAAYYLSASRSGSRFVREWSAFDLNVRNAKVLYLNRELGRPAEQDTVRPDGEDGGFDFDERERVDGILARGDLLVRERMLDALYWEKAEELTAFDIFDIDMILGFVARLKIVDRWNKLDPETGKELFRKLVEGIRSTYDNKKQNYI